MRPEVKVTRPRLRDGEEETVEIRIWNVSEQQVTILVSNASPSLEGVGDLKLLISGVMPDDDPHADPPHVVLFDSLDVDDERITRGNRWKAAGNE